ncbi:MAG: radical SAM protein [Nitrospirae bacterium]|nr:radical SAM protein [Nitrospirota bacterium]
MKNIGYFKIRSSGNYYLYDTFSNAVVSVEEPVYRILDDYVTCENVSELKKKYSPQMSIDEFRAAVGFIRKAQKNGLLQPFLKVDYSAVLKKKNIRKNFSNGMRQLMLNVTEQCNQRCAYCSFSGKYEGQRLHNNRSMTWPVAKRSIDCYLDNVDRKRGGHLSFYGGEPLLKWGLVRKAIDYINKKSETKPTIRIISNLTMLNDEMIRFVIANDVEIQTSIDGPRAIHDSARIFGNGNGTHFKVINNLKKIKRIDPDYFNKKVSVNCTLNLNDNILTIFRYFSSKLFANVSVTINGIYDLDTDFYKVSDAAAKKHSDRLDRLVEMYIESYHNKNQFNHAFFSNIFLKTYLFAKRDISPAAVECHPNRTCVPGIARLFVSSSGMFYPCEKFHAPAYDIGNYKKGFDIKKAERLLEIYVGQCEDMCRNCWAYRLCSQCFISVLSKGDISIERKREKCAVEKKLIASALRRFVYIWENEPEAAYDNPFSLLSTVRTIGSSQAR